jgi:hypothetical protein
MAKRRVADEVQKAVAQTARSTAERAARAGVEALRGGTLSEQEWSRQAKRLTEFVKLLISMGFRAACRYKVREDGIQGRPGKSGLREPTICFRTDRYRSRGGWLYTHG